MEVYFHRRHIEKVRERQYQDKCKLRSAYAGGQPDCCTDATDNTDSPKEVSELKLDMSDTWYGREWSMPQDPVVPQLPS